MVTAPVAVASPGEAADPCGFYRSGGHGWYRHCPGEPYTISITIYFAPPGGSYYLDDCVRPHENKDLGFYALNAWYNGKSC
ncbi:DUF6355 family natural product biosynthesis protein [Lentzea alba]|uniref:DUF6355 family natural product biosynthesis protein n=1 Tax=Lentzea alba TaxID=2714351 RepID=UPI0039BF356A